MKKKNAFTPFYQDLEWANGTSGISVLRLKIGRNENGYRTFKTTPISALKSTLYNRKSLQTEVARNRVYLRGSTASPDPYWNIEHIASVMNFKNPALNLTPSQVKQKIIRGEMAVRFNVVKKDHGTMWLCNETDPDDFFNDL